VVRGPQPKVAGYPVVVVPAHAGTQPRSLGGVPGRPGAAFITKAERVTSQLPGLNKGRHGVNARISTAEAAFVN